jgi:flagellar motor switch protein FliG
VAAAHDALPPPRKAAILCLLLGEEVAGRILRHLPQEQVQQIARELAELGPIEPPLAQQVLNDYYTEAIRPRPERGGPEVARRFLSRAEIPNERMDGVLGQAAVAAQTDKLLSPLLAAEPGALAEALSGEHPQTSALLLLHLPADRAAKVLSALPDASRAETVRRMATMRQVRGEVLDAVTAGIRERVSTASARPVEDDPSRALDRTAAVLQSLSRAAAREVLDVIERQDAEQAAQLRNRVFTFETIVLADDRGVQELLRALDTKTIALALHGADENVSRKFMGNLSERAASILKDEIEFLQSVRPDEQLAAQREILGAAFKLEEEGRLKFADGEA